MIRKFMKTTFPAILNVLFILALVGVCLSAFIAAQSIHNGAIAVLVFFLSLMIGGVGVILMFGVVYVLLDIRDSLERKQP